MSDLAANGEFMPGLTGRMPVCCQRCRTKYNEVPCTPDQDGHESTGICAACLPLEMQRIEQELAAHQVRSAGVDPGLPSNRPVFLPSRQVADACGLDEHTLHGLRPDHWGVPGHWRLVRGVCLYNEAHLPELVAALAEAGHGAAAAKLEAYLREFSPQISVPKRQEQQEPWFRKGAMA